MAIQADGKIVVAGAAIVRGLCRLRRLRARPLQRRRRRSTRRSGPAASRPPTSAATRRRRRRRGAPARRQDRGRRAIEPATGARTRRLRARPLQRRTARSTPRSATAASSIDFDFGGDADDAGRASRSRPTARSWSREQRRAATAGDFALARYQGGSDPRARHRRTRRPPTISGTAAEGQTLTVNAGAWTGSTPINRGYQWRRCDSAGANCVDIAAATATTYALGRGGRRSHDPGARDREQRLRSGLGRLGRHCRGQGEAGQHRGHRPKLEERSHDRERERQLRQRLLRQDRERWQLLDTRTWPRAPTACTASANGYRPSTQNVTCPPARRSTANFSLVRR